MLTSESVVTREILKRPKLMTSKTPRSGLTLIEILIALAITLIILTAMVSAFSKVSAEMKIARGTLSMADKLRFVEDLLRDDWKNLTVETRPYFGDANPPGYFTYIEGANTDNSSIGTQGYEHLGDYDDVWAGTVRSDGRPYRGRFTSGGDTQIIESPLAEVIWWTERIDRDGDGRINLVTGDVCILRRRVLLIIPKDSSLAGFNAAESDISIGADGTPNTLEDLAIRANRFAASGGAFPNRIDSSFTENIGTTYTIAGASTNDDVLIHNVAAFDLKIYSPTGQVQTNGDIGLVPSDPGYGTGTEIGTFIDLGETGGGTWFPVAATGKSLLTRTYDTWTPFYESNGIDDDGNGTIDEGTDGVDQPGSTTAKPDDQSELETLPPYTRPVRGMQATIRVIDPTTRQIRQSTVSESFVPE